MKQPNVYNYFKGNKAFDRFFLLLKEKYKSLGKCTGYVLLSHISKEESQALSLFLSENYIENTTIKINLKKFDQKIQCYFNTNLEDVLFLYFRENIITKKEKKKNNEDEREGYFQYFSKKYKGTFAWSWIEACIVNKQYPYSKINIRYNADKVALHTELEYIIEGLNQLPYFENKRIPLNIFAATISSNPHLFDLDTATSNLFLDALSFLSSFEIHSREDKIELLSKVGIVIDEISNYVTTYGLISKDLKSLEEANEKFLPTMLSLLHMNQLNCVEAFHNCVFVLENPIILWVILSMKIKCSVIITAGNPNIVMYQILDKLYEKGIQIYYNGDIDPEGLLIASKLKERYPNLILFEYDAKTYLENDSQIRMNGSRLKKLDLIHTNELQEIKKCLYEKKYPFYQENNLKHIIKIIRDVNEL